MARQHGSKNASKKTRKATKTPSTTAPDEEVTIPLFYFLLGS
jgi:hypothetical protein